MQATVAMPGSCGELVQGMIDGTLCHVTCPVDISSRVTVELFEAHAGLDRPSDRPKAAAALQKALAHWQSTAAFEPAAGRRAETAGHRSPGSSGRPGGSRLRHAADLHRNAVPTLSGCHCGPETADCRLPTFPGVRLRIDSPLPFSKGMASSTADVAGAIEAASFALGRKPDPALTAEIAVSVEPSDGTFFPGIVAFDHRQGKKAIPLGTPPPMEIIVFDCGGEVDTIAFNSADRTEGLKRLEPQIKEAFAAVRDGLARGDAGLIGRGATLSAIANQEILFKPQLEKAIRAAQDVGAAGVNVGHSGTVIGILLDTKTANSQAALPYLVKKLDGLHLLFRTRLVGGGGRLLAQGCASP